LYAAVVEPWLGKYDTLREIVGKYERGEISREQGARDIELRQHGGDRRSEDFQASPRSLKHGETSEYLLGRMKRDNPVLYERYERGEFASVKAAAREAGIVPPKLTKFEQIVKWLPSLSTEERRQLKELL
jgi:hypothetical protein